MDTVWARGVWFAAWTLVLGLVQWGGAVLLRHRVAVAATTTAADLRYAVVNFVKAVVLGCMTCTPKWWPAITCTLHACTLHGGGGLAPEDLRHHVIGCVLLYCASDACQFVGTPMSFSTKAHHALTTLFGCAMVACPALFLEHDLGKAVLWYGMCSCYAFTVNLYLGLRKLLPVHSLDALACASAFVYTAELVVNWTIHTGMVAVASAHPGCKVVYAAMTFALMWDDYILCTFLWRRAANACASKMHDYIN